MDWSAGANTINYITARNRVGVTGGTVGRFLDILHAGGLLQFDQTNIIGHSLGSHVAGHAGKQVTRGRINAIFGTGKYHQARH